MKAKHPSTPEQQPTVAITGADGFLGTQLVRTFSQNGWQVIGLVNDPSKLKAQKGVHYVHYTLAEAPAAEALRGADYLVHTAYAKQDKHTPNAYTLNVEGTKQLLAASHKHGVRKNIFMSSMSAQPDALSTYGKQKFEIEKLFDGPGDVVIRSGLIIGNGGLVKQMTDFIRSKHVVPVMGGGRQPLQVIAVYDLAAVIQKLLEDDHTGTFTIAEPTVFTYRGFYRTLARHLRTPLLLVPVPFFVPLFAIRTAKALRLPLAVTEDNLLGIRRLRSFDTAADLERIGVELDPLPTILGKLETNGA